MLHPSRKTAKKSRAGVSAARLRRALFDTQRARGRASIEVMKANRAVLLALLAGDQNAALAAREREYVAVCERDRCSKLVKQLSAELDARNLAPLPPDMRWVETVMPGVLRAVGAALLMATERTSAR